MEPMEPPIEFWLGLGAFITFLVVVSYRRWAQDRSDINAAALKMQQLGFASEQIPLKNVKGESFLFSYFCVVLGFGQRCFFAVSGGNLAERMQNLEWATNMQNTLCFTAVVCALNVLYNQQKRRGDAA